MRNSVAGHMVEIPQIGGHRFRGHETAGKVDSKPCGKRLVGGSTTQHKVHERWEYYRKSCGCYKRKAGAAQVIGAKKHTLCIYTRHAKKLYRAPG